jgi:hypothetical protein
MIPSFSFCGPASLRERIGLPPLRGVGVLSQLESAAGAGGYMLSPLRG